MKISYTTVQDVTAPATSNSKNNNRYTPDDAEHDDQADRSDLGQPEQLRVLSIHLQHAREELRLYEAIRALYPGPHQTTKRNHPHHLD